MSPLVGLPKPPLFENELLRTCDAGLVEDARGRSLGPAGAGRAAVGVGHDDQSPGAVVLKAVVHDRVVAGAGNRHSGPDRAGRGRSRRGHVGVVVVVDVVVGEHPAGRRPADRWRDTGRAGAVLRGGLVGVLAVGVKAVLVVIELGVLDQQGTAGVGPGVAERVVLQTRRGSPSGYRPAGRPRCRSPSR